MDKNLPDIDQVFRKAYEAYRDEPSGDVWEKLEAGLDKRDAEKYKKRFAAWRIAGILLFIACGILAFYKSSLFKTNKNAAGIASRDHQNSGQTVSKKDEAEMVDKLLVLAPEEQVRQSSADTTEAKTALPEIPHRTGKKIITPEVIKSLDTKQHEETALLTDTNTPLPVNSSYEKTSINKKKTNAIKTWQPVSDKQKNNVVLPSHKEQYINSIKENNDIHNSFTKVNPLIKTSIQTIEINHSTVIPDPHTSLSHLSFEKTYAKSNTPSIKISRASQPSWLVTAYASNDWSGYKMDDDDHHNRGNRVDHKDDIFERESHEGAFTLGINVTRQFRKWNVISGFRYAQIKIAIAPQDVYASTQSNGSITYKYVTSSGYYNIDPNFNGVPVTGDSIQSEAATHSLRTISIPFMAGYTVSHKKLSIIPSAGIAINYIAGAKIKTTLINGGNTDKLSINKLNGMHHFYLDFVAQTDLQYRVAKKWSINLIPSMKYAITPVTRDNVVKTFPYNVGVGAGVTYEF